MALYSERLVYTASTGWSSFRVPTAFRAVIKTITAVNFTDSTHHFDIAIEAITVWAGNVPAATSSVVANVSLVLYQGEAIWVNLTGPGTSLSIHGYMLATGNQKARPLEYVEGAVPPAELLDPSG